VPDIRRTAPAGRHEATGRGAHERIAAAPRHAAPERRSPGPALASVAAAVVVLLGFSLVRGGAIDSARAIGLPVPPFFTPSIGAGEADPAGTPVGQPLGDVDARTPAPTPPAATLTYTTTTGEVVVLGGAPVGGARTAVVAPWFPPVDETGAPVPSTGPASPSDAPTGPVELPTVPVVWTPDPTPTTTSPEPAPPSPTPDVPTATDTPAPTFEPSSPGPGITPTPSVDPSTPPAPTTTAPPAPTTPPAAPGPALRFAPPTLSSPTTVAFPEGSASLSLDPARDYIVTLPRGRALVNTNGLTISGGRNVVVIGGAVDVRDGSGGVRRGMYAKGSTPNGTLYVEGVRFFSSTVGALTEGIDIASPGARVVLQNIAIDGTLTGSYATNHADVVQAWAGPRVLEVDGLSASSQYQGFFLLPNQHSSAPVDDWSLHRVALTGAGAAYLAWRDSGSYSITTSDVYVSGSRMGNGGLWPNAGAWPDVTVGRAPEVYAGTAGTAYVSPGYR